MNSEKKDRRVRRTRKQLEESLIKLLKTKNIQQITVKELAETADITRATFYQHYRDPYDMLKTMQDEIIEHIQEIINVTTGGDAKNFFLQLFEYLSDESVRPEILAFDTGFGSAYERIGNQIHNNYMLRWGQEFTGDKKKQYEYYRYYIVFGCIAVVDNWVRNGKKETPEQMAEIALTLLPREKMYLKSNNTETNK